MTQYDFSPEARERSRLAGMEARARQKERMERDPEYAERVRQSRVEQRRRQLEKNPNLYREQRARQLIKDPNFDRKHNEKQRSKLKDDPRRQALRAATVRRNHLKTRFGLTVEDFDRMYEAQGGKCAVCPRDLEEGYKTHVDHCHETGKVRGLLCFYCNTSLGKLKEDEDTIRNLLAYIQKHKTN